MNEKYNALFTPWKIGNVEMKNRIVQCSMGGTSLFGWMEPNHFDKEAAYFLLNRAQDGVGLILPGMQCIRDPLGIPGRKWLYQNDQMFKQLKEYMVEFHKTGAKLFTQLAAGMGRWLFVSLCAGDTDPVREQDYSLYGKQSSAGSMAYANAIYHSTRIQLEGW